MYFSPQIGGTKGAFKNYEMDYYGYSIKPAIDWIEKNDTLYKSGKKARVRLWYGEQGKLSYYVGFGQGAHTCNMRSRRKILPIGIIILEMPACVPSLTRI